MAARDLAAFERGCGGGEERVAPHGDRRRSRMRGLADEADHVAFETECAEDDAGRLLHRFEHRSLLDVHLEIGLGVDACERLPRVEHRVELDARVAQRVDEPCALGVAQLADLVYLETAGSGRGTTPTLTHHTP